MKKIAALLLLFTLVLTAPAQAHKLTVHRAKVEIKREVLWSYDGDYRSKDVEVGHCARRSDQRVTCTVTLKLAGPSCFVDQTWIAHLSHDASFTRSVISNHGLKPGRGECATVIVTTLD